MAMDDSVAERCTFMVRLKPALLFLRSLGAMQGLNIMAVMVVRKGNVQFLVRGVRDTLIATLNMEASTISSRSSNFSIVFPIRKCTHAIVRSVARQKESSVLIYKIGTSKNLYCLVGDDSIPIHLGEVVFFTDPGIPIKELQAHPLVGYINSECFREVLSSSAKKYFHGVFFTKDTITWNALSGKLEYQVKNGDCYVENIKPGAAWYVLMEWLRAEDLLDKASWISDVVMISFLTDPEWHGWNMLSFVVDPQNYVCFLMEGPDPRFLSC